jgi:hypothetical protein
MSICRYCHEEILWAVTEKSHRIPLDPRPKPNGNIMLEFQADGTPIATVLGDPSKASSPLWLAHFASCPGAQKARRKR